VTSSSNISVLFTSPGQFYSYSGIQEPRPLPSISISCTTIVTIRHKLMQTAEKQSLHNPLTQHKLIFQSRPIFQYVFQNAEQWTIRWISVKLRLQLCIK